MRHMIPVLVLVVYWAMTSQGGSADEARSAAGMRGHVGQLLDLMEKEKALSPAALKEMRDLLKSDAEEDRAALEERLDAHCLVTVTINPESRVKAVRGSADVKLRHGRETLILAKVSNDAGVTSDLRLTGPGIRSGKDLVAGEWLEVKVTPVRPSARGLSGEKLEYVVLRLTPREAGKREATLQFDVGQGTQDLGFRAEVPILFSVERE